MGWENRVECGILEVMSDISTGIEIGANPNETNIPFDKFLEQRGLQDTAFGTLASALVRSQPVEDLFIQPGGVYPRLRSAQAQQSGKDVLDPKLALAIRTAGYEPDVSPLVVRTRLEGLGSKPVGLGVRFKKADPPTLCTVWLITEDDYVPQGGKLWSKWKDDLGGGNYATQCQIQFPKVTGREEVLKVAQGLLGEAIREFPKAQLTRTLAELREKEDTLGQKIPLQDFVSAPPPLAQKKEPKPVPGGKRGLLSYLNK